MNAIADGVLAALAAPAHALALLALGLFIGRQEAMVVPWIAFVAGVIAGLASIAFGAGETPAADVLLAASGTAGGLLAAGRALPRAVCAPLALVVGLAFGLDSPPEAISIAIGTAILIGSGTGAAVAVIVIAGATRQLVRPWQDIGTRILGSWIAASAILVLTLRFGRDLLR